MPNRSGRAFRFPPPSLLIAVLITILSSTSSARPAGQAGAAGDAVAVHLAGLRVIDRGQVLLILADESEQRAVPITVGRDQGLAIYLGKEGTATPRPMTHDLMVAMLKALSAGIDRVTVTALRNDTYFAEIALRGGRKVQPIDARPSDAIALALRLEAPIYVIPQLLHPIGGDEPPATLVRAQRALGLGLQELDGELARFLGAGTIRGVLVASVTPGGVADRAGVRLGDVLQEVDGRPTPDLAACGTLPDAAGEHPRFGVFRDGRSVFLPQR